MNKRKKKNLFLLLILVLFVSVGYALLSTTLNINGTTKVKNATWNIYWDNPQVTTGSVTEEKPTIDSAKTTASFNVELEKPGDFYEFTIDAKNDGTIDGMISAISYKLNDTEISLENPLPAYLNYTVTYSDDVELGTNHLLAANTKETYKVRVEFKKDIENNQLPGQEVMLSLKFAVTYIQADNNASAAHPTPAITYITRQNEGQITPGDVIGIGETEDFYVISSTPEKTVLLAKYNLLVGYNENINKIMTNENTQGYGLQSVDAVGGYNKDITVGTVEFTSNVYWDDGEGTLLSPYNQNNASYDGEPYPYVYDENSGIYQYISGENGYVNRLKEMGAPTSITGRILSYEEADSLSELGKTNIDEWGYNSIIFNGQDYWLGSAYYDDYYEVSLYGLSGGDRSIWIYGYAGYNTCGVRPVIEVPTSELQ